MALSEADRAAIILKKLVTPGVDDPLYEHIDKLSFKYRDLVYAVLREGNDKARRENRLQMELRGRGLAEDQTKLSQADPAIDLDGEIGDTWRFFSLGEAYQPLPPLEWVVEGMFSRPSLNIFFGPPKSLKTLFLQDLAISVASGKNWLPDLPGKGAGKGVKTRPTAVLWVDYENGSRRMRERFSAFGRALQLPEDTPVFCASMPVPWLDAGKKEQIGNLMLRIEHYQAGLIVVDHLTQITGDVDENTSGMAEVMGNLRGMVEDLDLCLFLVHHQVKGMARFGIAGSESLRGHGSILASCDAAFQLERSKTEKDQVIVKPVAERGANVDALAAVFSYEQKSDGSRELEKARFFHIAAETADTLGELAVLDLLAVSPGITFTALKSALSDAVEEIGDHKARQIIHRLEREKKIYFEPGGKGAKLYYLLGEE